MEQILPGTLSKTYFCDQRRNAFDHRNASLLLSGIRPDIVFIGDSITEFFEQDVYFREYGFVVNRGICGDVIEGVRHRFDADVIQLRPKCVSLLIGVNQVTDLHAVAVAMINTKGGYDDIFPYIDNEYIPYLLPLYEECFAKLKKAGISAVVLAVLPAAHTPSVGRDYPNYFVTALNSALQPLVEKYGFIWADAREDVVDKATGFWKSEYSDDRLHPNAKGYEAMVKVVKPAIDKIMKNNR